MLDCRLVHLLFQCPKRHYSVPAVRFTTCLEASESSNFCLKRFLGIGQGAGGKGTNFYICDKATTNQREVEKAFLEFTKVRKDIAILLITQAAPREVQCRSEFEKHA